MGVDRGRQRDGGRDEEEYHQHGRAEPEVVAEEAEAGRPDEESDIADRGHQADTGGPFRAGKSPAADSATGKPSDAPSPQNSTAPPPRGHPRRGLDVARDARLIQQGVTDGRVGEELAGRVHRADGGDGFDAAVGLRGVGQVTAPPADAQGADALVIDIAAAGQVGHRGPDVLRALEGVLQTARLALDTERLIRLSNAETAALSESDMNLAPGRKDLWTQAAAAVGMPWPSATHAAACPAHSIALGCGPPSVGFPSITVRGPLRCLRRRVRRPRRSRRRRGPGRCGRCAVP